VSPQREAWVGLPDEDELLRLEGVCLADPEAQLAGLQGPLGDDPRGWLRFCLCAALEACDAIRPLRLSSFADAAAFKSDGSPATRWEEGVELRLAEHLRRVAPEAALVGEETGVELPDKGYALGVDPVDGTWALLGRTPALSTSLVLVRDRVPLLGLVLNPATGELGYALTGSRARLVQLGLRGQPHVATWLPCDRVGSPLLVNLHPSRAGRSLSDALYAAWGRDELRMVRAAGGSPAWALLEAAKGSFVYVNLWRQRASQIYDLAGAVLLLRSAGGEVLGVSGQPVDPLNHRGLLVAGARREDCEAVLALVREAATQG
jgi:fructose-1,6-bisphosphatase/inositol monophosphatase family enzyme